MSETFPETTVQNPGSFSEFTQAHDFETHQEASDAYGEALIQHRIGLAAMHGISLEDLHLMQFPRS